MSTEEREAARLAADWQVCSWVSAHVSCPVEDIIVRTATTTFRMARIVGENMLLSD
jgi:hypothetical protein